MNKSISGIFKILLISLFFLLLFSFIYTLMIKNKTGTQNYNIPASIIGGLIFFIIGFLSSNHHQKKGILTSFLYSFIIVIILFLIINLTNTKYNPLIIVKYLIFIISSIIGGIFGVNVKKLV